MARLAALEIWRALGNGPSQAQVLDDLGNVAHDRGDFARAVTLHEEALALAREAGDRRETGRALNNLAMVALYQSEDELAWRLYTEALAVLRDVGLPEQGLVEARETPAFGQLPGNHLVDLATS